MTSVRGAELATERRECFSRAKQQRAASSSRRECKRCAKPGIVPGDGQHTLGGLPISQACYRYRRPAGPKGFGRLALADATGTSALARWLRVHTFLWYVNRSQGPIMRGERHIQSPLTGRVIVITGGASGIGAATGRRLDELGAAVALADVDMRRAVSEASRLERARAYELDVTDRGSFARTLEEVEAELGPPDTLISNAAVMALCPFVELSPEAASRQIDVNLRGMIHGMQLMLPRMLDRGHGHLVNVCSAAGRWGVPGESVYAATKHAMVGLTEVVRRELRDTDVSVSLAFMGPVLGPELSLGMKPTGVIRMVSPEAVGMAIGDLLVRPRPEVWIPRSLGTMYRIGHIMPRSVRERLEDLAGLGRVATEIDRSARAGYEHRVFGRAKQRVSTG